MSLPPFVTTTSTPRVYASERASSPERSDRIGRKQRVDPREEKQAAEKPEREATPPDFAMLLALLAGNTTKPMPGMRESGVEALASGEAEPTVDEFGAEASPEPSPDESSASQSSVASANSPASARSEGANAIDQREVARAIRADALRIAQEIMADANRGRRDELDSAGTPSDRSAFSRLGIDDISLQSLAERARGTGLGELLARNDRAAAGFRTQIDSLLDVAGTPRGRALVESTRPEFRAAVETSAADVTTAVRNADALAPAFRERLDRVIDRMRDEFGHEVQVVETVRSPERQDHLYAMGRTRPGPVVTWTTNSAHLSGEAADVMIDGKWHNPQGHARLHAIATEEGLHTLGMRDPGHLELRGASRSSAIGASRETSESAGAHAPSRSMSSNGMAQVAAVARVAQVASVAQVARPGSSGAAARAPDSANPSVALPESASSTATLASRIGSASGSHARGQSDLHEQSPEQSSRDKRRDGVGANERPALTSDSSSAIGTLGASVDRVLEGGAPKVAAPVGSNAAARAEAIAVLRDDAPARSINSLTMHVETPNGAEEVRVSLRGGTVGAQISTNDAALADRLRMQTADLQDALGRHGLDTQSLRVQSARTQDGDAVRIGMSERAELLKASGAGAGQQASQQNLHQHSQQSPQDTGARERPAHRHQPERESRDTRDDTHQQGRRNGRQENS